MRQLLFLGGMPIKTLGSLGKIRVGRVTGNTHIFLWPNVKCGDSDQPTPLHAV